jgi:predicted DNA-binding ribbon-helix-helix protein
VWLSCNHPACTGEVQWHRWTFGSAVGAQCWERSKRQVGRAGDTVAGEGVPKRSVCFSGIKTSISLEELFWEALSEIAAARRITRSRLIASIAEKRIDGHLSSALRVFVLEHCRAACQEGPKPETAP